MTWKPVTLTLSSDRFYGRRCYLLKSKRCYCCIQKLFFFRQPRMNLLHKIHYWAAVFIRLCHKTSTLNWFDVISLQKCNQYLFGFINVFFSFSSWFGRPWWRCPKSLGLPTAPLRGAAISSPKIKTPGTRGS